MMRALQPQADGKTFLFTQDGEPLWWGPDFKECIEIARIDSIDEVRKMIEREALEPTEMYAYDAGFRRRCVNALADIWCRLLQRFNMAISR